MSLDVNSMKPLDNLCHPVSVIKEAEELAAEAFRADHAFFMVGGTTAAVQSMVLSVCRAGDKIILPRNVHKSVINALVLCGAIPVYVNPEVTSGLAFHSVWRFPRWSAPYWTIRAQSRYWSTIRLTTVSARMMRSIVEAGARARDARARRRGAWNASVFRCNFSRLRRWTPGRIWRLFRCINREEA